MATSRSKKTDLLSEKFKLLAGNTYINTVYGEFRSNIDSFFSGREVEVVNGTRAMVVQTFQNLSQALSTSEINQLVANCNPFSPNAKVLIYNNPYVFWYLSNLTDNQLVSVLTTGVLTDITPNPDSVNEILSSTSAGKYDTAIKGIRDNQFSFTYSYNGYRDGGRDEIDFSRNVGPNAVGGVLGLLIFVDNQDINLNDSQIVYSLIKLYSNTVNLVDADSYTADVQKSADGYVKGFKTDYNESVHKLLKEGTENDSNRSGKTNIPAAVEKRPGLTDENFIIKNTDNIVDPSEVTPETITLNQFSQPAFDSALSILDTIRNKAGNQHIKSETTTIYIDGDSGIVTSEGGRATVGTRLTPITKVDAKKSLQVIKSNPKEYQSAKQSLENKISELKNNLKELVAKRGKIINSDSFILTCIITAIGKSGDSTTALTKGGMDKTTLLTYYNTMVASLENEAIASNQSTSVTAMVRKKANWAGVENLNPKFLKKLGIVNAIPDEKISEKTIEEVRELPEYKNDKGETTLPETFVDIVGVTNKGNTPKSNVNIKNLCQSVISSVRSTESDRRSITRNIEKYTGNLKELESA